ncbi:Integrase [Rhizobiales bacterium GAS113]|nr:Integrase [Rhizobiales bacterium GAS113]
MPRTILDNGFIRMTVRYVRPFKGGILYYYRRIPRDVQKHYPGRTFRKLSLGTRDMAMAIKKASLMARQDEGLWASLRTPDAQRLGLTTKETRDAAMGLLAELRLEPGSQLREYPDGHLTPIEQILDHIDRRPGTPSLEAAIYENDEATIAKLVGPVEEEAMRLVREDPGRPRRLLSDALDTYLADHRKGTDKRFADQAYRAIGHVTTVIGDLPLDQYRREHARQVRDALLASGNKTATVRRRFTAIVAVFNKGLREFDMGERGNPFAKVDIGAEGADATTRQPFTTAELATIATACTQADDDIRHIVAMLADTGARLAEIVGLRVEDVFSEAEIPHLLIQPHERLGRTLKTPASNRKVPLLGTALWGARSALEGLGCRGHHGGWLFPRYAAHGDIKATHASNTINKWLRETLKIDKTSHSFRHAMRDRLRHEDVPKELQDAIGGWGTLSMGQGYGEGYQLGQLRDHLAKVITWKEPPATTASLAQ